MRRIFAALLGLLVTPAFAAEGERITVTGEIIDTWCYYSGVMGGPDSVVGSAHHTCALWCSAGGIPVGLLGEDGEDVCIEVEKELLERIARNRGRYYVNVHSTAFPMGAVRGQLSDS